MIKVVIVDDEIDAITSFQYELNQIEEIRVLKCFTNISLAETYIENEEFDILFLDIEMPFCNGIDFLKKFFFRNFQVVFTTAYSKYAFDAYKNEILDYLLKPIDVDDIRYVLEKFNKKQLEKKIIEEYRNKKTINIYANGQDKIIEQDTIIYCEADGNYTSIYLKGNLKYFVSHNLKYFENNLDENFVRIHNSYLVNVNFIKSFNKKSSILALIDNTELPVSRLKKKAFLDKFKK